jgi:hypothetical protein
LFEVGWLAVEIFSGPRPGGRLMANTRSRLADIVGLTNASFLDLCRKPDDGGFDQEGYTRSFGSSTPLPSTK